MRSWFFCLYFALKITSQTRNIPFLRRNTVWAFCTQFWLVEQINLSVQCNCMCLVFLRKRIKLSTHTGGMINGWCTDLTPNQFKTSKMTINCHICAILLIKNYLDIRSAFDLSLLLRWCAKRMKYAATNRWLFLRNLLFITKFSINAH